MHQSEADKQHENFLLKKGQRKSVVRWEQINWGLLLLPMTGRHQTNVAGSSWKQILFETLEPGLAVPSAPVPTSAQAGKLSFG